MNETITDKFLKALAMIFFKISHDALNPTNAINYVIRVSYPEFDSPGARQAFSSMVDQAYQAGSQLSGVSIASSLVG